MSVRDGDDAVAEDGSETSESTSAPAADSSTETSAGAPDGAAGTGPELRRNRDDRSFGWRGWVVVAALVVSFVVVPWTIIYLQQAQTFLESLGLGLRDAYLVLPLIPALGLGVVAVWAAVANRRSS